MVSSCRCHSWESHAPTARSHRPRFRESGTEPNPAAFSHLSSHMEDRAVSLLREDTLDV